MCASINVRLFLNDSRRCRSNSNADASAGPFSLASDHSGASGSATNSIKSRIYLAKRGRMPLSHNFNNEKLHTELLLNPVSSCPKYSIYISTQLSVIANTLVDFRKRDALGISIVNYCVRLPSTAERAITQRNVGAFHQLYHANKRISFRRHAATTIAPRPLH